MIAAEIEIAGRVITPHSEMIAELRAWREPRLHTTRSELIARAVQLCRTQLATPEAQESAGGAVIARMTIRVLLRLAHHGQPLPEIDDLAGPLLSAIEHAGATDAEDLRRDGGRGARVLAQVGQWPAAYTLLRIACFATLRAQMTAEAQRALALTFDNLFLAACVHGWGEYHQQPDHVARAGVFVQRPFANLDGVAAMLENHGLELMLPMITYIRWFQPLVLTVHELPDRAVDDGGIGFSVEKDHPSPLIAHSTLLFGAEQCLEDLVQAVMRIRGRERETLLAVLTAMLERDRL
jgi:hypothetical protein